MKFKLNKKVNPKIFFGIMLLLTLVAFSSNVLAVTGSSALKMSFINQDPDPASPGEYVDLKFKIENEGNGVAEDVKVQFVEKFPFFLDEGASGIIDAGTVGGLQNDDLGVVIEYRVRVSSEAIEGNNEVEIVYWSKSNSPLKFKVDVEVKTQDSGLVIKSVKSDNLEPGKDGLVLIDLENPSDSTLRDVTLTLDLSSEDLPFAPLDSATTKKIKFLNSNSIGSFKFSLIPFPDSITKVYKIPILISYYDSTNQFVEKEDIIGVIVSSNADLSYAIDSSEFFADTTKGTLSFDFINKGLIDLKFLNVVLKDTDDYEVISSNGQYIGNVDSDDFETTDYIISKKNSENSFNVVFDVSYKDANNKDYSGEVVMPIKLYPIDKKQSNSGLIILVVVVLLGIYLYRRYKKKKNK